MRCDALAGELPAVQRRDERRRRTAGEKIPVYVFDATDSYGSELAERYKVDKTPTFVVLDAKYNPSTRFVGAGVAPQIADAFGELVDESCPIEPAARVPGKDDAPEPSYLPKTDGSDRTPSFDFRTRPTVYDISSNVGFLEDSNERWLNRGRKDEPKTAEPEKKPKLGERLTDSVVDSIVGRVANAIEKKGAEMKESAVKAWQAAKTTILFAFVALGVMLAQACAAFVKWSWRKLAAFVGEFREFQKAAIRSRASQKDKGEE